MALDRIRDMLRVCKEESDLDRRNTMLTAIDMELQRLIDNQALPAKSTSDSSHPTQRQKIDKMSAEVKDSNPYRFGFFSLL